MLNRQTLQFSSGCAAAATPAQIAEYAADDKFVPVTVGERANMAEPGDTVDAILQRPATVPANYSIQLIGFESKEAAERLDGVTVAHDYAGALKALDRGFPCDRPLIATFDFGQGVAMTPAVRRDGLARAHMVFSAPIIRPLADSQSPQWADAFYIVGHESAHVQLICDFDRAFPDVTFTDPFKTDHERIKASINGPCWDEYAASRLSAGLHEGQTQYYEQTFLTTLEGVKARTAGHRADFLKTRDHTALANALKDEYSRVLKYASYLLGHLHGLDGDLGCAPMAQATLNTGHWFTEFMFELDRVHCAIWNDYGKWASLSAFDGIANICLALMAADQVYVTKTPAGGLSVTVMGL